MRYNLRPLDTLNPSHSDVLVNLSGIFRDGVVNIVELLDDTSWAHLRCRHRLG